MRAGLAPLLQTHGRRHRMPRWRPVGAELAGNRHQDRLPVRVSILLWVALATAGWALVGFVVLMVLGRL